MKIRTLYVAFLALAFVANAKEFTNLKVLKFNELTQKEANVILGKGTERAFSGEYYLHKQKGAYLCTRCDARLYESSSKFDSGCGWPSFDDEIKGAIKRVKDSDGRRTEIVCANCDAHLEHVFEGEGLTKKNVRHCVNSISLNFKAQATKRAYFAGGCFWGVEHYFEKAEGVLSVESGYMGGSLLNPSYKDVVRGDSGHLELVEVLYDPTKTDYETLAKLFFEIHDPTQIDGQGPDIGERYLSAVFTSDEEENKIVKKLGKTLKAKGFDVVTRVRAKETFYKAEDYHQDYYERSGRFPYCHSYVKRF